MNRLFQELASIVGIGKWVNNITKEYNPPIITILQLHHPLKPGKKERKYEKEYDDRGNELSPNLLKMLQINCKTHFHRSDSITSNAHNTHCTILSPIQFQYEVRLREKKDQAGIFLTRAFSVFEGGRGP